MIQKINSAFAVVIWFYFANKLCVPKKTLKMQKAISLSIRRLASEVAVLGLVSQSCRVSILGFHEQRCHHESLFTSPFHQQHTHRVQFECE